MPWKCMQCGFSNAVEGSRMCEGCGHAELGRLVLVNELNGKRMAMGLQTLIGRRMLLSVVGEEGKYASDEQFEVYKDLSVPAWVVRAARSAKNPTFLNGTCLGDAPATLEAGAILSIGPERGMLRVEFEH